jgi:hypothetical protein
MALRAPLYMRASTRGMAASCGAATRQQTTRGIFSALRFPSRGEDARSACAFIAPLPVERIGRDKSPVCLDRGAVEGRNRQTRSADLRATQLWLRQRVLSGAERHIASAARQLASASPILFAAFRRN